jgi:hypothetical protein
MKNPTSRKPLTPGQFRNFLFAGRSIFTLENKTTNNYITFKVKQMKKDNKPIPHMYVVECKALGDRNYGYELLGFLNIDSKSFSCRVSDREFIGLKTWFWLLKNLEDLERFETLAIYHEGKCCKCGMPLTVPESIESGIGPECFRKMHALSVQKMKDNGTWDDSLDYETNLKNTISKDPAMWGKLYIPDGFKKEEEYVVHRLFERMSIF